MNFDNFNLTAIFVDFENLRRVVFDRLYKRNKYFFDYNANPQKVVDFCNLCVFDDFTENSLLNLYRIFFYSARPSSQHPAAPKINLFFSQLEQLNHTAVRYGKLVKRGEQFVQKQVDMLLGIDMAEIAIKKFVNRVVLIGYDSDMSPALKLARCNGIQTQIILFNDANNGIDTALFKHCDIIKKVNAIDFYRKLGII